MRIAITTPSGKIGSKLVDLLFDRGDHELMLLTRNRKDVQKMELRGAQVFEGDLEDREFFLRATLDADELFFVLPMDSRSKEVFAECERMITNATDAVKQNGIERVVFVSSIGAHLDAGVGPIRMMRRAEKELGKVTKNLTVLRPVFYMDQLYGWMKPMTESGELYLPFAAETTMPMIAARDVATFAADVLTDSNWSGHRVLPLHGPKEYSFTEMTRILNKTLGIEVKPVQVDTVEMARHLLDRGWSEPAIDDNLEMMGALAQGKLVDEMPRSKWITRPTTFEEFAQAEFKPAWTSYGEKTTTSRV